jgi:hypothetical protein
MRRIGILEKKEGDENKQACTDTQAKITQALGQTTVFAPIFLLSFVTAVLRPKQC